MVVIMDVLKNAIRSVIVILIPLYTYKSLLSTYWRLENEYKSALLFYRRHNCVVMYSQNKGMNGWPPYLKRCKLDLKMEKCLHVFREPLLYFINTANESLDVAFMLITITSIYSALIEAHKRGVKIRILLNFEHSDSKLLEIQHLLKEGIDVLPYVSQKPGKSSIMHYKFMVKDYSEKSGFVFTGSLNLTENGLLNNFEDIVFTSNQYVARAFHQHFEECWDYIRTDNEHLMNKTLLLDSNLI